MLSSLSIVALCALSVVAQDAPVFTPSQIQGHFVEQFAVDSARWSPSQATKESDAGEVFSYVGEWSVEEPTVFPGISGDKGLVMKSKAAHHAISVPFSTPLESKDDQSLVIQYEVKLQKGLECGGAYIKLLTDSSVGIQAEEFSDKTPYTIMFGPDRCGSTSKVHFIFRHANPITGEVEEKHLVAPPAPRITKVSTLYTLIVRPDQSFEIKINGESQKTGSLLTDFLPAVNPEAEIDDPTDSKPAEWVESPKIADVDAVKPADWDEDAPQYILDASAEIPADWLVDEPSVIPDPDAEQPEEWSTEDDGDWDAPTIPNPKCTEAAGCGPWTRPEMANPVYKGKWFAPLIDNPEYKGVWAPAKIPNPAYFQDLTPSNFGKMAGVGIELWSMTEDILFDNIYIGHSESDAEALAHETFSIKKPLEDALEAAAIPETPESTESANRGIEPDYREDPIAWVQFKVQEFADIAVLDPVAALKQLPATGAAAATVVAILLGLLSFFFSFLIPSPKPVKKVGVPASKKTDAVTPDVKVVAEATKVVEEPVVAAEKEGVKTRKSKAAQ